MRVLAGDIGGTKVRLGLFDETTSVSQREYESASHPDLESICADFLDGRDEPAIAAASLGIAGPIVDGRTEATNLPWVIEGRAMERLLGCPVRLLNDLEATAHGIGELSPDKLLVLNEGVEVTSGTRAIIAAGTGLGQGYLTHDPRHGMHVPRASEGGHVDFAPRDEEEIALLRFLQRRHGRVSVERVVSGMGIRDIFEHLEAGGRFEVPDALRKDLEKDDPAAVISRSALEGKDPICVEAMRRFVSAYGSEAGNLALKVLALGGVYIGGGIAPKILPLLREGTFMESFRRKGRFADLVGRIPVRVILDDRAALLGAAADARRLAGESSDPV